ncbi:MAG: hypothetical protein DDT26_02668 [Dehalococcoidia bacterium]|nr:hypothetical protein [Chloroflexota bacterium]
MIHSNAGSARSLWAPLVFCLVGACTLEPGSNIVSELDNCTKELLSFINNPSSNDLKVVDVCPNVVRVCSIYFGSSASEITSLKSSAKCPGVAIRVADGQQGLVVIRKSECPAIVFTTSRIQNSALNSGPFCTNSSYTTIMRPLKPVASGIVLKEGF